MQRDLSVSDPFAARHIGPSGDDQRAMLAPHFLLTNRQVLAVVNVGENELDRIDTREFWHDLEQRSQPPDIGLRRARRFARHHPVEIVENVTHGPHGAVYPIGPKKGCLDP